MLRRFLYLDERALSDYLSAVEGGTRESAQRRTTTTRAGSGGVDLKAVSGRGERSAEEEETLSLADTATARFERLVQLAKSDPDANAWVDVLELDTELAEVGIGTIVEIECEIYVPDTVKMLSAAGGLPQALDQLDALTPFAAALGLDTESGLPNKGERDAVRGFVQALGSDQVLVGEFDSSDWRVVGPLAGAYVNGEIEGMAKVVGKVATRWPSGEWKPLLALPGTSLIPREQRRRLQRTQPKADERDQYLEGPAVLLDVLAVYR